MSTGNGGAAIGLEPVANKVLPIGGLVADVTDPTAGVVYMGDNTRQYWNYNWLGESSNASFLVPSCNAGTLVWGTNGLTPLTVPVDGRLSYVAGEFVAAVGVGVYKTFIAAGTVIPAGSYFWVEG